MERAGRPRWLITMNDVISMPSVNEQGKPEAAETLLPLVYGAFRRLAAGKLARATPGRTLPAAALVPDAYLLLLGTDDQGRDGCRHFFAAVAEVMRRNLIQRTRQRTAAKASGGRDQFNLAGAKAAHEASSPRKARHVKLRDLAGPTVEQASATLSVSISTAENDGAYARARLRLAMLAYKADGSGGGVVRETYGHIGSSARRSRMLL